MKNLLIEFKVELLTFLISIEDFNQLYLILLLLIISTIVLSLPIPGSFTVILNSIFLGFNGFFLSIISAFMSALIIYSIISKFIKNYNFNAKYQFLKKYKKNLYILIIARIIIPFPICSYLMSIIKINKKNYLLSTFLGTIPGTLSITMLFSSIKNSFINEGNLTTNLFNNKIFLISIFFILIIVFLTNFFKKKFL